MSRGFWTALVGVAAGAVAGSAIVRRAGRRELDAGDLRAEIARLRERAEQRRRDNEAIVRRSAHDLRNPLTTIRARAELLKRLLGDGHANEMKHVEAILRSAQKLEAMIAQLSSSFGGQAAESGTGGPAGEPEPGPG